MTTTSHLQQKAEHMGKIVLATSDDGFEHRTRRAFDGQLNGELRRLTAEDLQLSPRRAVDVIAGGGDGPDVVVLGPGLDTAEALELARRFDRERPEISLVLIAPPAPELWEQAARAGVRDVLAPDAPEADLRQALERAAETATRRRANLVGSDEQPDGPSGRVITLVSPKGGSGKTTVAANLAVGLAEHAPGETVIVDLDLQFGDVSSALQLLPEHTIADAARNPGAIDAMALKVYLAQHASGLYALCAPDAPADGERVSAEVAAAIVTTLAEEFRYVVVDSSAGISEPTLSALEVSTDVVLVCSMDVPSIRSLRKAVAALDQLGMTSQRRHLVLNRADARVGLSADDVEATIGLAVDVAVPSSRAVPLALNQGVPVITSDPRSAVARGLRELVNQFVEQPARTGGMLAKLRSTR